MPDGKSMLWLPGSSDICSTHGRARSCNRFQRNHAQFHTSSSPSHHLGTRCIAHGEPSRCIPAARLPQRSPGYVRRLCRMMALGESCSRFFPVQTGGPSGTSCSRTAAPIRVKSHTLTTAKIICPAVGGIAGVQRDQRRRGRSQGRLCRRRDGDIAGRVTGHGSG